MEPKTMTLAERLRMLAKMIALGDRIQWGSDSEAMLEAASALEAAAEALEPFSELHAERVTDEFASDETTILALIAFADIRRARSVLAKLKGE